MVVTVRRLKPRPLRDLPVVLVRFQTNTHFAGRLVSHTRIGGPRPDGFAKGSDEVDDSLTGGG
jgi:hypothetical protein